MGQNLTEAGLRSDTQRSDEFTKKVPESTTKYVNYGILLFFPH